MFVSPETAATESSLMYGNRANDAPQPHSTDSGYFSILLYVAADLLLHSSPQVLEDGGAASSLYITNEAFVHLSCGWVAEGRERGKERQEGRGRKEKGRVTKRHEDRGRGGR